MAKLEGWAGDLEESLEHELKDIDREIKEARREAQFAASLELSSNSTAESKSWKSAAPKNAAAFLKPRTP